MIWNSVFLSLAEPHVEKGQISGNRFTCSDVQKQDLSVYQKAFEARCTSSREEALV